MQTATTQPTPQQTIPPVSHAELMALYKGDRAAGLTDAKTFREWLERSGRSIEKTQPVELRSPEQSTTTTSRAPSTGGKKNSKASIAREIFKEELDKARESNGQMSRKLVLERFQKEANMSPSGANTYYQNFRDEFNLVKR